MADINPNDSATLTDDLEIDSYDDVVNLFGADEAAAMLADVVGNRFNRQEILKAIRSGGDIHLDYWPEYGEYGYAARICGDCENAGTFTVKPGRYEPILGIYDPVGGCGGAMGTVLDCDFEIDPHDISYTMMEPVRGEWKSDRIDLYTPQDCFGFSDPFGGRIEYNEKKPEVVVAAKPDPVELGHRASVAAGSTAGDRARGAGIRQ